MYRDDAEAARQRSESLEQELREAQHDAPGSLGVRLRALEEELAGMRAGLETRARHVGEMQSEIASIRRTNGVAGEEPLPRAPTRTWLAVALTVVLVLALCGVFVFSLAVAGDALRIFTRGTSEKHAAAAPPPLTERELRGFPGNVDVDAVIYAVMGDHPGARLLDLGVSGVEADGFMDVGEHSGNIFSMAILDARGRVVSVSLTADGLSRTDAPGSHLSVPDAPVCTIRLLWESAVALGAPSESPARVTFDAKRAAAPWGLELDGGQTEVRYGPDCVAVAFDEVLAPNDRELGDYPLPHRKATRDDDPYRAERDPFEAPPKTRRTKPSRGVIEPVE